MNLSETVVEWSGLRFFGRTGRYTIHEIDGWEGWQGEWSGAARPQAHGSFDEGGFVPSRTVRMSGLCATPELRDAFLAELGAHFAPGKQSLTVTRAGRTLMADARLVRYRPVSVSWATGAFAWEVQWVCPDPLRYGVLLSVSSAFPELVGGLRYPLYTDGEGTTLGWLDYGEPSTTGTVELTNTGTAEAWPIFEVAGPTPADGFEIVASGTGRRLVYSGHVPAGSRLVIDTGAGTVVIDGVSDRTLSRFETTPIQPGSSQAFTFIPRGSRTDAILVASVRPAHW